jgi:hypothetical protein
MSFPYLVDRVGSNPIAFRALDSMLELPQAGGRGASRCSVLAELSRGGRGLDWMANNRTGIPIHFH